MKPHPSDAIPRLGDEELWRDYERRLLEWLVVNSYLRVTEVRLAEGEGITVTIGPSEKTEELGRFRIRATDSTVGPPPARPALTQTLWGV